MEQEEMLCDEVETVKEFTYLGDRVISGAGCETALPARSRCWWVKFREFCDLLYGRRLPLKLKCVVSQALLYRSEA